MLSRGTRKKSKHEAEAGFERESEQQWDTIYLTNGNAGSDVSRPADRQQTVTFCRHFLQSCLYLHVRMSAVWLQGWQSQLVNPSLV